MFSASLRHALIALAMTATAVSAAPGLSLKVSGLDTVDGVKNLKVITTLTNVGDETLKLFNDPRGALNTFPTDTFSITTDDGASPDFIGVKVKYSPSQVATLTDPSVFTVLTPGQSVSLTHDLSLAYNFTNTGLSKYTIKPSNRFLYLNADKEVSAILADADSYVASLTSGELAVARGPPASALSKRATFSGCSNEQQSILNTAASSAQTYAADAVSYLQKNTNATDRYTTWFGTYDNRRHNTVQSHFTQINSHNFSTDYTYNCNTCRDPDLFAYVFANQFPTIYLCNLFWDAANTGTDSRAGTLVHESSHFLVNGGTSDYVYTQSGAESLAERDPDEAVQNADSHEFFAENSPRLS